MKTALYLRVSLDDGSQDPENQALQMREWCAANGHEIVQEYVDRQSGADASREQLGNMLRDAKRGRFKAICFWSLDRLSREGTLPTLRYLEQFTEAGCSWRSHQEPYLDTLGPFADAVISILASIAKIERTKISERTKAGIERARKAGKQIGNKPIKVPVKRLIALREKGLTMPEISRIMGISRSKLYSSLKTYTERKAWLEKMKQVKQQREKGPTEAPPSPSST